MRASATPFAAFGYATGALCLALENYHNMAADRRRVDSEVIDLHDFAHEVAWLAALVEQAGDRPAATKAILDRLTKRFAEQRAMLKRWVE